MFFQRSLPPDPSAAGTLLFDLAAALRSRGWDVWIAGTSTGKNAVVRESYEGVQIVRIPAPDVSKKSLLSRAFSLPAIWVAMLRAVRVCPTPDILVTLTDPPLSVCAGAFLSWRMGCRHVHWCQDLYPGVAAAAGILNKKGAAYRILQGLTTCALKSCDQVVAVGRCMQERLTKLGIRSQLITNWSRISPVNKLPPVEEFRVLYSGNLGRAHDFEGLQSAAILTREHRDGVTWIVCGDGPQISVVGPGIERLPPVPWSDLPALFEKAHVHLVTLRSEFSGLVVPSKLYDAAASGRPVVFAGPSDSECARAITENEMGLVIPDRDGVALADAVVSLMNNDEIFQKMAEASREFGFRHRLSAKIEVFDSLFRDLLPKANSADGGGVD